MSVVTHAGRLQVPLAVPDALRRGRPREAERVLREANPGLDAADARQAIVRLAANPSDPLDDNDPYRPGAGASALTTDTLPSEVAASIATGNTVDAARRLQDVRPDLSEADARDAVARHCSPLLRQAREHTVVRGDSGRYGWLGWALAVVVIGGGLAVWLG